MGKLNYIRGKLVSNSNIEDKINIDNNMIEDEIDEYISKFGKIKNKK